MPHVTIYVPKSVHRTMMMHKSRCNFSKIFQRAFKQYIGEAKSKERLEADNARLKKHLNRIKKSLEVTLGDEQEKKDGKKGISRI